MLLVACGGKPNAGHELARLDGDPVEVQVLPPSVVFKTTDPNEDLTGDKVEVTGTHELVISIPLAGGQATELARIPSGDYRVGRGGVALTARDQVAVIENGSPRKVATLAARVSNPVWIDGGIVVLANDVRHGGECCDLTRVSTKDASTSQVGKLKGIGHAIVAVDGSNSYMGEVTTGETVKIDPAGTVSAVGSPGDGVLTCLSLTQNHIWWGRIVEKENRYIISAMPRAGGPITSVTELAQKNGVDCAGGRSELFYTEGKRIMAVAPGQKPRIVFETATEPRTLAVDGDTIYWAEPAGKQWSIRSAPIR